MRRRLWKVDENQSVGVFRTTVEPKSMDNFVLDGKGCDERKVDGEVLITNSIVKM